MTPICRRTWATVSAFMSQTGFCVTMPFTSDLWIWGI